MAAYVVVDIEVTDPTGFQEYLNVAGPMVAKYGGRLLAAGPPATMLEGTWQPKGVTLIEFPSVERAQQWHTAPVGPPQRDMTLSLTIPPSVLERADEVIE